MGRGSCLVIRKCGDGYEVRSLDVEWRRLEVGALPPKAQNGFLFLLKCEVFCLFIKGNVKERSGAE